MIDIDRTNQFKLKQLYNDDKMIFFKELKTLFIHQPITQSKINQVMKLYQIFLDDKSKINEEKYEKSLTDMFKFLNIVKCEQSDYGILFLPPYKVVEKESKPCKLCPTKVYWYEVYDEVGKRICTFELKDRYSEQEILIKYELNFESDDLPF